MEASIHQVYEPTTGHLADSSAYNFRRNINRNLDKVEQTNSVRKKLKKKAGGIVSGKTWDKMGFADPFACRNS